MSTTQVADEAQSDTQTDEREGRSGAPRPEKVEVVEEVREQLSSSPATLLTEYRGLSVSELAELRAALREADADYVVVKNTLARIAARDAGFDGLEEFLTGPTALTYCNDDPVGPAKALRKFAKDHPELVVKGGILEGRVVDAETADKLADLESREDLLARFAQLMYGALANTASLLEAPLSKMARLLAAYQEEGDLPEGEAPDEEPEAADDAAATEEPETADEPETAQPEAAEAAEAAEATDETKTEEAETEEAKTEEAEPDEAETTDEPDAADEAEETPEAEEPAPEPAEDPEAADEPEASDETDEDDEDEGSGLVEAVADTATDAVETVADAAETAVDTAAETAKDVAEDTPAETPVDIAAEVTETAAEVATDTVEGVAETAADAVSSTDEDDEADEHEGAAEATDEDEDAQS